MAEDFSFMTISEMSALVRDKSVSPVEIVENVLRSVDRLEPQINAFVTVTDDLALDAARKAESAVMAGEPLGVLAGIPMTVKDLITVGGVRCTFGSNTLSDNVATADAPAVERIKAAGACIIGKTTTTEFGCKPSSTSPVSGTTRNPWNTERTTGGSSSGGAAGVCAGIVPAALGTDGGGSIRIPSAFCGLFGIKAQFGRVPVFPPSATPTLAHIGPLTRTVRDGAIVLGTIAGFDGRDPASVSEPVPDFLAACDAPLDGVRIAWSPTLGYARPNPEIVDVATKAIGVLEELGCEVTLVDKVLDDPIKIWMAEFYAGVGTRLKETMANERDILDPAVAEVLSHALDQTIDEYYGQVFERYALREKMREFFEDFDLLISPTLPVEAFNADADIPDELSDMNIVSWMAYPYWVNLIGAPAASVPCGFTNAGLPVGLQMVSRTNREVDLFRVAAAFEVVHPWAGKKPPVQ
ncbi:MAG: amidase [Alphaproteobacteria bacterium]|nr:amidase [Alphaproteobacteria bacterium]MBT7942355.1 amidase [Alphaproteobacteria bacterium]